MVDFPTKSLDGGGPAKPTVRRPRLRVLPDLRQEEPAECAAVVLALALWWFGRRESVARLRRLCQVSRHGASALDLARAAESCGLTVLPVRVSAAGALALPPPVVALVEDSHFVLITRASHCGVSIADPATGPRRLDREEFSRLFSGVALALTPGPEFRPGGEPVWRFDATLWKRHALFIAATVPFQAGAVVLTALSLSGAAADDGTLLKAAGGAAVLWGVAGGLDGLLGDRWQRRDAVRLGATRLGRRLAMAVETWSRHHPAALAAGIGEASSESAEAIADTRRTGRLALACFGVLLTALQTPAPDGPALAGLAAAVLSGGALIRHAIALAAAPHRNGKAAAERDHRQLLLNALPRLGIDGAGQAERLLDRVATLAVTADRHAGAAWRWETAGRCLTVALAGAGTLAGLALGAVPTAGLPAFLAALPLLAGWLIEPPRRRRFRPADATPEAPQEGPTDTNAPRWGVLSVESLSYARPGSGFTMQDIDLRMAGGERIALVGASGSGKTTFLELLAGLLAPTEGHVTLDGSPVPDLPIERRAGLIGYVAQDIRFLDASVRSNLAGLDDGVPEDSLTDAAQRVGVHERIARRRTGYQTSLARDGDCFSAGERTLLDLARVLALRPTLLLLDQPTATLASATARTAWEAVLACGASVVVSTHSPEVAADCDRCVLLDRGRITAIGPHEELIRTVPLYRTLMGQG
ncbi:ATP-binding cassette domain-containing protein [Azospirillum sp. B510]|uniref:ATP-binding cassette domain-containing protein n=1 Tax=Azospirillum sp. (strain B510) TaxID=137722 RepID=UPI0002E618F5|nr:ATP-binding cassette domain-containing protein [Azospirillum sp. B510]